MDISPNHSSVSKSPTIPSLPGPFEALSPLVPTKNQSRLPRFRPFAKIASNQSNQRIACSPCLDVVVVVVVDAP